jgi:hypothetical protein
VNWPLTAVVGGVVVAGAVVGDAVVEDGAAADDDPADDDEDGAEVDGVVGAADDAGEPEGTATTTDLAPPADL